jgi:hypothetical protein
MATYRVSIPLFNADGTSRIGPDVKTLTLRIVTNAGELSASYDLKEFVPKPTKTAKRLSP